MLFNEVSVHFSACRAGQGGRRFQVNLSRGREQIHALSADDPRPGVPWTFGEPSAGATGCARALNALFPEVLQSSPVLFLRVSFRISSESKKANLFVPFTASKERHSDVSWQGISGPQSGGFPCPWSISAVSQNKGGRKQGINPAEIQAPPLRIRFDLRGGAPERHVSGFPGVVTAGSRHNAAGPCHMHQCPRPAPVTCLSPCLCPCM